MATNADSQPRNARKGVRAKQACRECNTRRVRCNVAEMQPCSCCRSNGSTCEVLPSRRGRYVRKRRQLPTIEASEPQELLAQAHTSPQPSRQDFPSPRRDGHELSSLPPVHLPSPRDQRTRSSPEVPEPDTNKSGLFFGESNLLTYVSGGVIGPKERGSSNTRHTNGRSLASSIETPSQQASYGSAKSKFMTAAKSRYLHDEGVFSFPSRQDGIPLLQAYFHWFQPCFPIIDRSGFAQLYNTGKLSPLLLNALLFVGATYCDEDAIQRLGLGGRRDAKNLLYNRAKLLFEAEWETDRFTVVQAVFLLSFRRPGPADFKDVRYWLSLATTLAQSCGLHRRSLSNTAHSKLAQMGKRMWWSIYVRDRQSSASLGLPSRIVDEDCDVEELAASDLEADNADDIDSTFGSVQPDHVVYVTKMAGVGRLLGKIMNRLYAPSRTSATEKLELMEAVEVWKQGLPDGMREWKECNIIWIHLLHLAYNHLKILIHRNALMQGEINDEGGDDQIAVDAACRITRIVEDMLSRDMIQFGQMHSITTIFASLCIHTVDIRKSTGIRKALAEHRAQLCLLGLKEIQRYWMINNNILDLFFQYMDEKTAKRLHNDDGAQQRINVTSTPQDMQQTLPTSDGTTLPQTSYSGFRTESSCDIDLDPSDLAGSANQDPLLRDPFNWSTDDLTSDFGWLTSLEMHSSGDMNMQDISMLQRYL